MQGFEVGADDYVVKPFSMRELLLRVRALLERSDGHAPGVQSVSGTVAIGTARVDFDAYSVERDGHRRGLSRRELELLRYFLAHEGETLDRLRLLSDVWDSDATPTTRTVDTHVFKLRKKLEQDPEHPRHILTVHGVGYRFDRRGLEGLPHDR